MGTPKDFVPPRPLGSVVAKRYRLLEVLGAGGMGAVYRAEHTFTRRQVAVKLMLPSVATSTRAVQRFLDEARAPAAIGHPGIVEVLDGGQDEDGALFLVLELLEGEDLQSALHKQRLSVARLVQLAIEVLEILEVAHAKGFIHRDIKPENIYLQKGPKESAVARLLDFGIARRVEDSERASLTDSGEVIGTVLYMSPEQARGERVDARTDLWAVAAVLFRALAGRELFFAPNFNMLVVAVVTAPVPSLAALRPDLPKALLDVVDKATRRALEERFQSAREMADALRECEPLLLDTSSTLTLDLSRAPTPVALTTPGEREGAPPAQPPAPVLPSVGSASTLTPPPPPPSQSSTDETPQPGTRPLAPPPENPRGALPLWLGAGLLAVALGGLALRARGPHAVAQPSPPPPVAPVAPPPRALPAEAPPTPPPPPPPPLVAAPEALTPPALVLDASAPRPVPLPVALSGGRLLVRPPHAPVVPAAGAPPPPLPAPVAAPPEVPPERRPTDPLRNYN